MVHSHWALSTSQVYKYKLPLHIPSASQSTPIRQIPLAFADYEVQGSCASVSMATVKSQQLAVEPGSERACRRAILPRPDGCHQPLKASRLTATQEGHRTINDRTKGFRARQLNRQPAYHYNPR